MDGLLKSMDDLVRSAAARMQPRELGTIREEINQAIDRTVAIGRARRRAYRALNPYFPTRYTNTIAHPPAV
jgi:hypothetical protein